MTRERVDKILLAALLAILACLLFGCNERTTSTTDGHQVKEVTKHTPTQDGGFIEERTLTHQGQATEVVKDTPDTVTAGLIGTFAPIAGAAIGAATGTTGLPWETLIAGAATIAATGWGALKAGQSKSKDQVIDTVSRERDFHKDDADQAYRKLDERAVV